MKPIIPLVVAIGVLTATTAPAAAPDAHRAVFRGREFAGQAKVGLAQARAIAGKARPGTIIDQELEKQAGGSGLRYAFEIMSHGRTYEVGVDARTGRILENAVEAGAREAREATSGTGPRRR